MDISNRTRYVVLYRGEILFDAFDRYDAERLSRIE
jgi:ferric-dicitrate binding protein FerR (iron transport regulator)